MTVHTITLSNCISGMYPAGSCVSIGGDSFRILSNTQHGSTTILTVSTLYNSNPYPPGGVELQYGQGTSKACVSCQLSLVCGYHQEPVPFYFCPSCRRMYVPVVTDAKTTPMKVKQILIKKGCPVRTALDLKEPCWDCANKQKFNKRSKREIYKRRK
jgi:hypothetical protein